MSEKQKKRIWFLPKPLLISAAASLLLAIIFAVAVSLAGSRLYDQQAAQIWETDGEEAMKYAQLSVFLARDAGLNYDSLLRLQYDIDTQYIEDGIYTKSESETARLWVSAASAEGTVSLSRGENSAMASVAAVIGDYFLFHPLQMMSGQYLNPQEASKDYVMLDWNTAWRIFGGYDVEGMQVEIAGYNCIVAGVFEKEEDDPSDNRIIMSFELYERINGAAELNVLEFILPNPVTGHGLQTVEKNLPTAGENRVVVENSSRFKLGSLFNAITDFDETIAQSKSIALPYFENRARVAVFRGGVFLLLTAVFAILPLTCVMMTLVKIYRRRREFLARIWKKIKRDNEETQDEIQDTDSGVISADDNSDDALLVQGSDDGE